MSVLIERFGGLNLRDDPQEVGAAGAISLMNVDFAAPGRVRSRWGTTQHAAVGAGAISSVNSVGNFLYFVRGTTLERVSVAGAVTTLGTLSHDNPSIATLGTPTASFVFFTQSGLLKKWDGATYSDSVGKPLFVATTARDNRLVQASFGAAIDSPTGANGSLSTVFFSDAGAPETFGANNYVHLHPGDGESILGVAAWRGYLFVFKRTRLFVFHDASVDGSGNPVFNYRTVDLPSPIRTDLAYRVVAGEDAVYLVCLDGIYRTNGDVPVCISNAIRPIFDGGAASDLTVNNLYLTTNDPANDARMSWADDRLFFSYRADSTDYRMLVWDRERDYWSVWKFGDSTVRYPCFVQLGSILYTAKTGKILKLSSSVTTDDGTAIDSHYQSGWDDFLDDDEKDVRGAAMWGSGSPTLSVFTDYGSSDALAAAVTLGTAPAVARGLHPQSWRGRLFSYKISAASGAWSVNRLALDQYP